MLNLVVSIGTARDGCCGVAECESASIVGTASLKSFRRSSDHVSAVPGPYVITRKIDA